MKFLPVLLSGLLVLAAAGRFNAEAEVREKERALDDLRADISAAERDVAQVRLDVEVLESATRLSELNTEHLKLRTVRAGQMVDERDFARLVGVEAPARPRAVPESSDVIGNAISMADLRLAARVTANAGVAE